MTKAELADLKKQVIFKALDRNFEWAKRTNEISMQAKKWSVGFWLVFVSFFVSQHGPTQIRTAHYIIGLTGFFFFALVDALQHFYSDVLDEGRARLMRQLERLPSETEDELRQLLPAATRVVWSAPQKFTRFMRMFAHETLWLFYGGLAVALIAVLRVLKS